MPAGQLVVIESPWAAKSEAQLARHKKYIIECMRDSLLRKESPFASHVLYSLSQVLDENQPAERELGIATGLCWARQARLMAVYVDLGISPGMQAAIEFASRNCIPVEFRQLAPDWETAE